MGLALSVVSIKRQANLGRLGLIHGVDQKAAIVGGSGLISVVNPKRS